MIMRLLTWGVVIWVCWWAGLLVGVPCNLMVSAALVIMLKPIPSPLVLIIVTILGWWAEALQMMPVGALLGPLWVACGFLLWARSTFVIDHAVHRALAWGVATGLLLGLHLMMLRAGGAVMLLDQWWGFLVQPMLWHLVMASCMWPLLRVPARTAGVSVQRLAA